VIAGVLLLAGPTGSGKTELALELAERFDAEIVGADSRQIYRGMEIGTAAPTAAQRARVPHHLVGFLDPHERYSAGRYVGEALAVISGIAARGRRALVVGGTGFYLRALAGNVVLERTYDPVMRARLAREVRVHPPEVLHAWLHALEPRRAAAIAPRDPYRIARALEVALARAGPPEVAATQAPAGLRARGIPFVTCWLEVAADELERRIERRVDAMLEAGLVAEAERIGLDAVAADAVGYREALAYAAGWSTRAELRAQLIRFSRRYAKRQATWFRSEPAVVRRPAGEIATIARERLDWT
jgi:tRNA dimethylallyltransferase